MSRPQPKTWTYRAILAQQSPKHACLMCSASVRDILVWAQIERIGRGGDGQVGDGQVGKRRRASRPSRALICLSQIRLSHHPGLPAVSLDQRLRLKMIRVTLNDD